MRRPIKGTQSERDNVRDGTDAGPPHHLTTALVLEAAGWGAIPALLTFGLMPNHPSFLTARFLFHFCFVDVASVLIFLAVRRLQYRLRTHLRRAKDARSLDCH